MPSECTKTTPSCPTHQSHVRYGAHTGSKGQLADSVRRIHSGRMPSRKQAEARQTGVCARPHGQARLNRPMQLVNRVDSIHGRTDARDHMHCHCRAW